MEVFDRIANDFHLKRRKPWRPIEYYVKHLNRSGYRFSGYTIDLGCANGRHFKLFKNRQNKLIGIDFSLEFLKIAKAHLRDIEEFSIQESNNIQLLRADLKNLPIRENVISNIFSIATIHHVKDKDERERAIRDLYTRLKDKGFLIITVWRKWQKRYMGYFLNDLTKRVLKPYHKKQQEEKGLIEFGDKYVPWTLSQEGKTYYRFYHFFSKREIKKILQNFTIKEFLIMGGPSNKDNFFIFAQK